MQAFTALPFVVAAGVYGLARVGRRLGGRRPASATRVVAAVALVARRQDHLGALVTEIQQAGGGPNDLLTAPHSVPKNRGAAMMEVPRRR